TAHHEREGRGYGQRVGKAADWLRQERRKVLGDWVAFCLGCGAARRWFEDFEAEVPDTCPQCGGELLRRCKACGAPFSSLAVVDCGECRDRREVDLELVAGRDLRHRVPLARGEERRDLPEVVLEAGGRDELEEAERLVAGVPERVLLAARLAHDLPRPRLDDLSAKLRAEATLEHVRVLVL